MSEVRLNLISREWVILSKERAKRPHEFVKKKDKEPLPEHEISCPFCPGNEGKTPPEKYRVGESTSWKIRVIPNKFYALAPGESISKEYVGLKRCVSGVGLHDVLVETPRHNAIMPMLDIEQMQHITKTYKIILLNSSDNPIIQHLIIFKNHGEDAGTSLIHPHSQIIGTPIVPMQIRDRLNAYLHFYEDTGACIFCKTIDDELHDNSRIIMQTKHFVVFVPYAALSPFHIWVFPRRHNSTFAKIDEEEMNELAGVVKSILTKLFSGLNDPSYNMVIRTLLAYESELEYFHWYISIVPRVSKAAGFELGSGMFINSALPEESAEFLKNVPDEYNKQ
ncbi:MAG: galactose-1-phosphate uridylyltransferase [Candidatus Fischerbacteria bacterium RBG_13_37_8]|uniref:Galactose-1-phosphate uridylyltransferase n=1 Tax=Candidatus Fischerbacteria bacterium RBG_13_37_8 TaxID=1817863 RepID=A0A1F5VVP3_9BACT|nr:MAG: galactose-1-phosphate uridylyltransferase [Candidatus Fischerbacteria bacterium RBG_13_37_8]